MYMAKRSERWSHTSNVMAIVANCHRDPKRVRRPFDMVDFLPADLRRTMRRATGIRLTPTSLRMLKPLFEKKV